MNIVFILLQKQLYDIIEYNAAKYSAELGEVTHCSSKRQDDHL